MLMPVRFRGGGRRSRSSSGLLERLQLLPSPPSHQPPVLEVMDHCREMRLRQLALQSSTKYRYYVTKAVDKKRIFWW